MDLLLQDLVRLRSVPVPVVLRGLLLVPNDGSLRTVGVGLEVLRDVGRRQEEPRLLVLEDVGDDPGLLLVGGEGLPVPVVLPRSAALDLRAERVDLDADGLLLDQIDDVRGGEGGGVGFVLGGVGLVVPVPVVLLLHLIVADDLDRLGVPRLDSVGHEVLHDGVGRHEGPRLLLGEDLGDDGLPPRHLGLPFLLLLLGEVFGLGRVQDGVLLLDEGRPAPVRLGVHLLLLLVGLGLVPVVFGLDLLLFLLDLDLDGRGLGGRRGGNGGCDLVIDGGGEGSVLALGDEAGEVVRGQRPEDRGDGLTVGRHLGGGVLFSCAALNLL
mmetsp:Transcript_8853/g.16305  ORF Transcript_8853/g.16305 Transcript_8853/m.16305 type:complete len:324 (+) Transcript_8853:686-1657(+)